MKYFFWIAFAVFLAASIPHVAYFFASFEPSQGSEGIWWWAVSYAIAISIDVTVYLLSWTAFQRYRKYRSAKAVWQHWLLIVICTVFSWAVNWAYARQFHSPIMLSSAERAAPWLINVFPFMASAFPLLGIVYTMMAETISETSVDKKQSKIKELQALNELAKQTQLPISTLRRALGSGDITTEDLVNNTSNEELTKTENPTTSITGQFVTLEEKSEASPDATNSSMVTVSPENNPDKLQMTLEALKNNPHITDDALAERLALKRPASARFWRLKAVEILNAAEKEPGEVEESAVPAKSDWATTGELVNARTNKR